MSAENRTLRRRHLLYYLEVRDEAAGDLLGYLIDISTSGIKLMSRAPVAPGKSFGMRMELPSELIDRREVRFAGTCKWCALDVNPDFYDIGFEVADMSGEVKRVVNQLITRIGFND